MNRDAFENFFCGRKYTPAQNAFELWLLLGMIEKLVPWLDVIVEIGVYKGGTFRFWREIVGDEGLVIGVDSDERGYIDELRKEYVEDPAVDLIVGDSMEHVTVEAVRTALEGRRPGLLFIDGRHDYKHVRSDYERYRGFVKPGGLLVFHDIENQHVRRVWKEIMKEDDFRGCCEIRGSDSHKGIGIAALRWDTG